MLPHFFNSRAVAIYQATRDHHRHPDTGGAQHSPVAEDLKATMASPLIGMDRETFERIKTKAIFQLDWRNDTNCDAETMALQIAWLNRRYYNRYTWFALLDAPDLDVTAFQVPRVHKTFLFHEHQGIWSVALLQRGSSRIIMYDGVSSKPSNRLHEDHARTERLCSLCTAFLRHLPQLGLPANLDLEFRYHAIVSFAQDATSAAGCLAWAEAKLQHWPIGLFWEGDERNFWIPVTDELSTVAEIQEYGHINWSDVLRRRARSANFERLTGA
ncbi:hypothetical protein VTK56DRAFT_4314 [Thermocarpiscus australiensis]